MSNRISISRTLVFQTSASRYFEPIWFYHGGSKNRVGQCSTSHHLSIQPFWSDISEWHTFTRHTGDKCSNPLRRTMHIFVSWAVANLLSLNCFGLSHFGVDPVWKYDWLKDYLHSMTDWVEVRIFISVLVATLNSRVGLVTGAPIADPPFLSLPCPSLWASYTALVWL